MALSQVCVDFPGFWTSGYQFNIRPYAHRCLTSPVHLVNQLLEERLFEWLPAVSPELRFLLDVVRVILFTVRFGGGRNWSRAYSSRV